MEFYILTSTFINADGFVADNTQLHLGGNYPFKDNASFVPHVWSYLIKQFNIKTAIDLGGGYGFCTEWMLANNVECINVDGLLYNIDNAVVSESVLHDLTDGPFEHAPVDFVNCIVVVEHVKEEYVDNLMKSLTLGQYVLLTHARPGQVGYHHVNCQPREYWVEKFDNYGYKLSEEDTAAIREMTRSSGWHVHRSGLVFIRK
jgi:hypothetical protein